MWLCSDQECSELLFSAIAHTHALYTPPIGWFSFTTNEQFILLIAQLLSSVIEYLCMPCISHQSGGGYYQHVAIQYICIVLYSLSTSLPAQLAQLHSMGITHDATCLHALEATNGNVEAALEILMGGK